VNPFKSSKILCHPDRMSNFVKGERVMPVLYEFDLTNRCNHRCIDCIGWATGEMDRVEISTYLALNIIREISFAGGKAVTFTGGGEPTLHPDFVRILESAKKYHLDIGLMTNGSKINKNLASFLAETCSWVRISLDAWDDESFSVTHRVSGFDKICEGIKILSSFRERCTVGVGFLTNAYTSNGMFKATKLVKELGADYIQFRPYHNDPTSVLNTIIYCRNYCEDKNFKVLCNEDKYKQMHEGVDDRGYDKCYANTFVGIITADANMYPCCHLRGIKKYIYGSLNKNGILEILNSENRDKVDATLDFTYCPRLCKLDHYNKILVGIANPPDHVNFL